jgi:penicillin amidase
VPAGLDVDAIDDQMLAGGRGGRGGGQPPLIAPYASWPGAVVVGRGRGRGGVDAAAIPDPPGSNNWVVNGRWSATGKPVVANDPHREVSNPSLRYVVHLHAPGWNVIGAVEAPFLGVAIGHNERLAWGLTIVGTDQEDVYVETVNPASPNEVRWRGGWEPMRLVREQVVVKGEAPRSIELKFTRHGPVFHEDRARHLAYALRSALLEPGTAPYQGALRLAQSTDCRQFLDAAMYWRAPTENLICGDVDGNISWQASALTPDRAATGAGSSASACAACHALMSKALGGMPNFCLKDREKSAEDPNPQVMAICDNEGGAARAIRRSAFSSRSRLTNSPGVSPTMAWNTR